MCILGGPEEAVAHKEVRYHLSPDSLCMAYIILCFYRYCSIETCFEWFAYEIWLSFHVIVTQ